MADLDNRIDFSEYPVDFSRMGLTGQSHDEYPAPNTAARFDLMRQFLIGLLANQASNEEDDGEPFEKRTGTLWFKKLIGHLAIYDGEGFVPLAKHIGLDDGDGGEYNLQSVIDTLLIANQYVAPRIIWSGFFSSDEVNEIPIPEEYLGYSAMNNMKPLVYIDGLLVDPRKTVIRENNSTYISIDTGIDVVPGQNYTVILEHVTSVKSEDVVAEG